MLCFHHLVISVPHRRFCSPIKLRKFGCGVIVWASIRLSICPCICTDSGGGWGTPQSRPNEEWYFLVRVYKEIKSYFCLLCQQTIAKVDLTFQGGFLLMQLTYQRNARINRQRSGEEDHERERAWARAGERTQNSTEQHVRHGLGSQTQNLSQALTGSLPANLSLVQLRRQVGGCRRWKYFMWTSSAEICDFDCICMQENLKMLPFELVLRGIFFSASVSVIKIDSKNLHSGRKIWSTCITNETVENWANSHQFEYVGDHRRCAGDPLEQITWCGVYLRAAFIQGRHTSVHKAQCENEKIR